jgi:hypothetical protein
MKQPAFFDGFFKLEGVSPKPNAEPILLQRKKIRW